MASCRLAAARFHKTVADGGTGEVVPFQVEADAWIADGGHDETANAAGAQHAGKGGAGHARSERPKDLQFIAER